MATLGEIASLRTSLADEAVAHLHRLVAAW